MPCCLAKMQTLYWPFDIHIRLFVFLSGLGSKSYEITTHKSHDVIVFMSMSIKRLEFFVVSFLPLIGGALQDYVVALLG